MKITDLKTTIISVPHAPGIVSRWASGVYTGYTAAITEVMTDEGIVGLGESRCSHPTGEITKLIIDSSRPYVIDEDPFDVERIMKKLYGMAGWNRFRHTGNRNLCGIEMALWDIVGKACGKPLYKLLGGAYRKKILFMGIVPREKPDEMVRRISELQQQKGFKTFYLKVGIEPEEDLEIVKTVRDAVGNGIDLVADANQMWSLGAAVRNIRKLEKYDLKYIEQPVPADDVEGMATVRRRVSMPILAHESGSTLDEVLRVVRCEAADVLQADPRYSGGILGVKKVAAVAEAASLPIVMHTMGGELGISQSVILHLIASTPNFIYANQSQYWYLSDDIVVGERYRFEDGCLTVPEKPGLGVDLDPNKMQKYAENYQKAGQLSKTGLSPKGRIPIPPLF
jgi:L-alanine-DL-glutamate epimerase-like enolase superfamily enzyme